MKFSIRDQELFILRGESMRTQRCPFTQEDTTNCGDWCPHFGEVHKNSFCGNGGIWYDQLELCHGKVITGEFVDAE